MKDYFRKMLGSKQNPTRVSLADTCWGLFRSMVGMSAVAVVDYHFLSGTDFTLVIGSFGATAVLLYAAKASPLAQPRNLMGGHIISAVIGVTIFKALPEPAWLAAALAVSLAIAAMHLTKTLHPPGGATALIAVIGSDKIHNLGYSYVIMPVAAGALIMLVVAVLLNNIRKGRSYPLYWY